MDSSRTQERLFSFAVSAMLTSAVLATAPAPGFVTAAAGPQPAAIMSMIEGARSAGFAGMMDMPAPAAVAAPAAAQATRVSAKSAPTLTPAQLLKIRDYAIGPKGKIDGIRAGIAYALGIGPSDRSSRFPSVSATDDETNITWEIFVLPDAAGYVIGRLDIKAGTTRFFKMDVNMNLILGITVGGPTTTPVPIPTADAPALFAHDLTEWVDIADAITP